MKQEMTYEQARAELDALVKALEEPQADLGRMTTQVKRAVDLIAFCRDYLRTLTQEVDKVLDEAAPVA